MKKLIILLLLVIDLVGCHEKLDEELVYFEDVDFSSGDYKIYVFATEGEWIEDYKNFIIDDIEILNEIKKRWVFEHKIPPSACGYGYNLKLVDNEKIVKSTSINVDCEYMSGWIEFPKEYLSDYKSAFERLEGDGIKRFSEKYLKE
uniref:Uncharacterized protein n=1 Tax=Roseihalotalea indica TaxID=2867963 RepID=A0AA49GRK0_9BACT|nr:hypothetical protein K4G66_01640 [Tunicatimonas sp. TK19036]